MELYMVNKSLLLTCYGYDIILIDVVNRNNHQILFKILGLDTWWQNKELTQSCILPSLLEFAMCPTSREDIEKNLAFFSSTFGHYMPYVA